MKEENTIMKIVISIVVLLIMLFGVYIVCDKYLEKEKEKQQKQNEEEIIEQIIDTNMSQITSEYKAEAVLNGTTNIDLKLFDNSVYELKIDTKEKIIEHSRGIYKIVDNTITLNRVLYAITSDYGNVWTKENDKTYIPSKETYIFEENNSQINISSSYINTQSSVIALIKIKEIEYQNYIKNASEENIVNKYESNHIDLTLYENNVFELNYKYEDITELLRGTYKVEDNKMLLTALYDKKETLYEIIDNPINLTITIEEENLIIDNYSSITDSSVKGTNIKLIKQNSD